jgi:hypothetical protein
MKFKTVIYFLAILFFNHILSAQEIIKDEHKIQEVVFLPIETDLSTKKSDSVSVADTMHPKVIEASEILKRAVHFVKVENKKYTKSNGITSGTKAECNVSFVFKLKELNPVVDAQGTISMHVSIDAKDGKYRYTISKITHAAANSEYTGGDVYNEIPKCGSMKMPPEMWKRIKSEALKQSAVIANDIKEAMKIPSNKSLDSDEW